MIYHNIQEDFPDSDKKKIDEACLLLLVFK